MIYQETGNGLTGQSGPITPSLSNVRPHSTLALFVSWNNVPGTIDLPTDTNGQEWKQLYAQQGVAGQPGFVACFYLLDAKPGTHGMSWTPPGFAYMSYSLVELPPCYAVNIVSALAEVLSGTSLTLN